MFKMILSISPEDIELIIKGKKKYDFRKFYCKALIKTILLYVKHPVKAIVGEAKILNIIKNTPENVWKITKKFAGMSKEDFDVYYRDKNVAIAYELGNIKIYKTPKSLKDFNLDEKKNKIYRFDFREFIRYGVNK